MNAELTPCLRHERMFEIGGRLSEAMSGCMSLVARLRWTALSTDRHSHLRVLPQSSVESTEVDQASDNKSATRHEGSILYLGYPRSAGFSLQHLSAPPKILASHFVSGP